MKFVDQIELSKNTVCLIPAKDINELVQPFESDSETDVSYNDVQDPGGELLDDQGAGGFCRGPGGQTAQAAQHVDYVGPRVAGLAVHVVGIDRDELLEVGDGDGVQRDPGVWLAEVGGETSHRAAERLQQLE